MTKWHDDLQNQRDLITIDRNKALRELSEIERAKVILEGRVAGYDSQLHSLNVAIDPETFETEAFKRGFQSAESMAKDLAHNMEKQAMATAAGATRVDHGPAKVEFGRGVGGVGGAGGTQDELAKAIAANRTPGPKS